MLQSASSACSVLCRGVLSGAAVDKPGLRRIAVDSGSVAVSLLGQSLLLLSLVIDISDFCITAIVFCDVIAKESIGNAEDVEEPEKIQSLQ